MKCTKILNKTNLIQHEPLILVVRFVFRRFSPTWKFLFAFQHVFVFSFLELMMVIIYFYLIRRNWALVFFKLLFCICFSQDFHLVFVFFSRMKLSQNRRNTHRHYIFIRYLNPSFVFLSWLNEKKIHHSSVKTFDRIFMASHRFISFNQRQVCRRDSMMIYSVFYWLFDAKNSSSSIRTSFSVFQVNDKGQQKCRRDKNKKCHFKGQNSTFTRLYSFVINERTNLSHR